MPQSGDPRGNQLGQRIAHVTRVMNRSLLLVICDFLLLSLLALARFEDPVEADASMAEAEVVAMSEDPLANDDLLDLLRAALEQEQNAQNELETRLSASEQARKATAQALADRRAELTEQQQELEQQAARLEATRQQAEALRTEKSQLETRSEQLAQQQASMASTLEATRDQLIAAQAGRAELANSLSEIRAQSSTASERARLLQAQLQDKSEQLQSLQSEAEALAEQARLAELAQQTLTTELKAREVELSGVQASLELARKDIEVTRQEKQAQQAITEQLAAGVGTLAESQDRMAEAVKKSQPKSVNQVYADFEKAAVQVTFTAQEATLFGSQATQQTASAVLVSSGEGPSSYVAALLHIDQTPLRRSDLIALSGLLYLDKGTPSERKFRFVRVDVLLSDPRIVAIPLPKSLMVEAGREPLRLAADINRYAEAVLVGAKGQGPASAGYGSVPYLRDTASSYLKLEMDAFERFFGSYAPETGDFTLDLLGEFLGITVNSRVLAHIDSLQPMVSIGIDQRFDRNSYRNQIRNVLQARDRLPAIAR